MTTTTPGHVLHAPSTPARPRRVTRHLAALAGGLALVVAVPVALSAPASAATPTTTVATHAPTVVTKHSTTTVHLSKKTQTRGKAVAKLRVTVHVGSAAAAGKVVLKVGSKTWKTVTLKHGTVKVRVSKSLKAGKHRITAIYQGAAHVTRSKASAVIKVKKGTPKVVTVAKKYVGTPYRSGANGPRAFDCSGFTRYVFKKAGIKTLPRTSSAQHYVGKTVSRKNAKPGDIIWSPGHVAIYLGGNKMIDAPRPGKTIQVRSIWQSHPTFVRVSAKAVSA